MGLRALVTVLGQRKQLALISFACIAGFQAGSGAAGSSSMSQEQEQADGVSGGANDNPWLAHSFQRGKIPEAPPPPEVC